MYHEWVLDNEREVLNTNQIWAGNAERIIAEEDTWQEKSLKEGAVFVDKQ